ncbi:MAG: DmsE family decaheme c-type cytochrome [Acidobacteriota bacterium]
MPGHRWTWLAGALVGVAVAVSWTTAAPPEPKQPVDWVALNPAFQGATFVNDPSTCQTCHDDVMARYEHTRHAKAYAAGGPTGALACESCHGPRSAHVNEPTGALALTSARAQSAVCLQCHQGGPRMGFKAGPHLAGDASCTSCHVVMEAKSERALLAKATERDTCYSCHTEIRAELGKMSHHPVREGRMACSSCHNTHGSTPALLAKATLNDTCFTCHAEKRGPFVWEHAPARESCATCHVPHGSNQRTLLSAKDPFLCLSCHSYGGHINLPRYNRTSNPYGNGCSNCHLSVHGSNHPSGAKLTR